MNRKTFVQTAFAAIALLAAGCSEEAEKTQLQAPTPSVLPEETSAACEISWQAVENASCYSWKLFETAEPETAVKEDAASTLTSLTFSDLEESTEYTFSVMAVAPQDGDWLNSATVSVKFKTGAVPHAEAPAFRAEALTDVGVCVTWSIVEGASYKYRIVAKDNPSENLNGDADKTFDDPFVTLSGLKASTSYIIYVQSVPAEDSGMAASDESAFEFTTEAAATSPWVAVAFEYRVFADKNTLIVHNVPNSQAANYYTTTENQNIIGNGLAKESTYAYYVTDDYEYHTPGVYANTSIHKFNDNGQGWSAGKNLFYAAVGETKNGDLKLNWFWLEMPENPGDDVKILDSAKK